MDVDDEDEEVTEEIEEEEKPEPSKPKPASKTAVKAKAPAPKASKEVKDEAVDDEPEKPKPKPKSKYVIYTHFRTDLSALLSSRIVRRKLVLLDPRPCPKAHQTVWLACPSSSPANLTACPEKKLKTWLSVMEGKFQPTR